MPKFLLVIAFLLALAFSVEAQTPVPAPARPREVSTLPATPCNPRDFVSADDTTNISICKPNGLAWSTFSGGGAGVTGTGTNGQVALWNGVSSQTGIAGITWTGPATLNLGLAGTSAGNLVLAGATSGTATIGVPAVAGTTTINFPTTNGANTNAIITDGAGNWSFVAGNVTIATTAPVSGGQTVNLGGGMTIACATCTTSAAALTANQLVIGSGGQTEAALGSLGSTVTVLHGNAAGAPSFSAVGLTTDVTGTLPVGNGGTGAATLTANNVLLGNGTSAVLFVAPGSNGNVLTSNGTTWISAAPGGGTVTSFSSGNMAPVFTTSVSNPTTTPALSFTLNTQSANQIFGGPASGAAATPTFRTLVAADVPAVALASGNSITMIVANEGATGTTVNKLAKLTGAPSTAIITATSDNANAIGIVVSGAGITGNANVAIIGQASCVFDGATTAGDYFGISSSVTGDCTDLGAAFPNSVANYGRVLSTNAAGGTFTVELMTPDIAFQNAGNGKSRPGGSTLQVQYNNAGVFGGANVFIEDANTVALRNSTTAQKLYVYNTFTSSTNFERGEISWSDLTNALYITAEKGSGGGTARKIYLGVGTGGGGSTAATITWDGTNFGPGTGSSANIKSIDGVGTIGEMQVQQSGKFDFSSDVQLKANTGNGYTLSVVDSGGTNAGTIRFIPRAFTASSGNNNNPDYGTGAYIIRVTADPAGSTLTGARGSTVDGEMHRLANVSTNQLILSNQNANSTAGNRWITNTGMDINLSVDEFVEYWQDATTARNRVGKFENADITVVTTQFDKVANTTLADVTTDHTINVSAGRTYYFRAIMHLTLDATGGQKVAIGGTATATSIVYQVNSVNNTTNLNVINSRQTALGGAASAASGTSDYTEINGEIVVNAAGTLTFQFAQSAASGTSSVLVGSTFEVTKIR